MSFLSRFSVTPQFPPYKGPYTVASFELEIPVSSLPASQKPPNSAEPISTVQFRVFYPTGQTFTPAEPDSAPATPPSGPADDNATNVAEKTTWAPSWFRHCNKCPSALPPSKSVYWLPEPHQREYLSGYARFLGAGSGLAELISYIPRILHHIAVPAISLAPLLPTAQGLKFPTMIFSHGLGGTRLAYSHICGSMASYGMVVIVPEHRDGSAPVTFIKSGSTSTETEIKGPTPGSNEPGIDASSAEGDAPRVQIDHTSYPHTVTDETADGRNRQLEIRLWELSLIYSAVAKLDVGEIPVGTSMFDADVKTRDSLLSAFQEKLDIRTPGRLIWAGHSFGSSTMIQMIKSVYYAKNPPASSPGQPLYTPDLSAGPATTGSLSLAEQITATTPLLLLDIWCLPLLGKRTRPLWKQPLPQIGTGNADRVFIVMSENFFKWRENMEGVRRVLSKDPGQHKNSDMEAVFGTSRPSSPDSNDPVAVVRGNTKPPIYYVKGSAHLNQSDFGILFPRAIKKGADPELILDLNVRAACQWLRESGYDAIGGEKEDGMLGGKDYGAGDLAPERWIRIDLDIQG